MLTYFSNIKMSVSLFCKTPSGKINFEIPLAFKTSDNIVDLSILLLDLLQSIFAVVVRYCFFRPR